MRIVLVCATAHPCHQLMRAFNAFSMETEKDERLKAAVHLTVGKICEEVGVSKGKTFTKPIMASIAELTYQQLLIHAKDLELFAKHAKRTTITDDDVKLLVRRNDKLLECVQTLSNEISASKKKAPAKPSNVVEEVSDDGDDFV